MPADDLATSAVGLSDYILARKPLAGTVARNVMQHGTGGLNIDACRIGAPDAEDRRSENAQSRHVGVYNRGRVSGAEPRVVTATSAGRWPAHLVLSHAEECGDPCAPGCPAAMLDEQSGVQRDGVAVNRNKDPNAKKPHMVYGGGWMNGDLPDRTYGGSGGASRFFATFKGDVYGDPGSLSGGRFFYTPKPARSEKEAGLRHLPVRTAGDATGGREDGSAGLDNPRAGAGRTGGARNIHPTVKPIELMRWLCRLITPPGGIVLDMFAGSGTTLVAAIDEDFRVVGCELDSDEKGDSMGYMPILVGRVEEALARPKQLTMFGASPAVASPVEEAASPQVVEQPGLFDAVTTATNIATGEVVAGTRESVLDHITAARPLPEDA